jgi:hypothetical protein
VEPGDDLSIFVCQELGEMPFDLAALPVRNSQPGLAGRGVDFEVSVTSAARLAGAFAPIGARALYASDSEETLLREVSGRKGRLGGKAMIDIDIPDACWVAGSSTGYSRSTAARRDFAQLDRQSADCGPGQAARQRQVRFALRISF